jgi:membrane protein implicated in regulation of membrane protease activity
MTDEQTIGQLVASASRDLSALVRSEIELAKAEMKGEAKSAAMGGGMFGAAGFLGVVAFILLTIAAAYGLTALGLHPGWAFLIVAAVYLIVAGVLALVGRKALGGIGAPERTVRTTKETIAYLKNPTSTG